MYTPKFKEGDWIVMTDSGMNNTCHEEYKNAYEQNKPYQIKEIGKERYYDEPVYIIEGGIVIYAKKSYENYSRAALPEEIPNHIIENYEIF